MYYKKNYFLCYTCGMLKIEQWNVTFCRPNGFNHVNKFVSNYVLTNISSVVEFERWWFLKSKISGPKSIYSNTQPVVQTLFLFKSIWIRPQVPQRCQKMCQDPLNKSFEVWCANIAPERHKLRKTIKIEEKMSKKPPVFLDISKHSSISGQS